jgi:glycosyltransferase 2 family protein
MENYAKWITSSILISILSIAVILIVTLDKNTVAVVREIRPEYILAALLIHIFSFVVWGMRVRVMSSALGHQINLLKASEIVVSGTFVAALTPSSIGGEPLRIHLLRQDKMPLGQATAVVVTERLLDTLLILLAVPFSLYLFRGMLSDSRLDLVLLLGVLLSAVSLVLMLGALLQPLRVKLVINNLLKWMIERYNGKKIGNKLYSLSKSIDGIIDEFNEGVNLFFTDGRAGLFYGIIFTVLYWIVEFASLPVILMGLNQPPSVLICFAAQALLIIIIIVPLTPGSSGVAELAATSLFSVFMPASILGIAVLAWRAFTFYVNILVGGFVSLRLLKETEMVKKYLK